MKRSSIPPNFIPPSNPIVALSMLATGDLPPGRRRSSICRVQPLGFGFFLGFLAFALLIVWMLILGPGQ
jgi:hypothetical protein